MSAGLFRIESAGPADSGGFLGWPAARLFQNKLVWLSVILAVAAGAWKMSEDAAGRAEGHTVGTNFVSIVVAALDPTFVSVSSPCCMY